MAYKIIITDAFEKGTAKTSHWIKINWSLTAAQKFDKKVIEVIESISLNPNFGRKSKTKNIRSRLVTRHNRIYYRIQGNTITILEIFETKTNPHKNKFE